jgi:acetyl esterase/lipase
MEAGALIYFHGGGYSVGSVEEFENGLRIVAEEPGCQVLISLISFKVKGTETLTACPHGVAGYAIDYRLAAEFRSPPTRRVLYSDRLAAGRPLLR